MATMREKDRKALPTSPPLIKQNEATPPSPKQKRKHHTPPSPKQKRKHHTPQTKKLQKNPTREETKMLAEKNPQAHFFLPTSISLLFLTLFYTQTDQAGASSFIYAGCSPSKYDPNTPYQTNLNSLLSSLIGSASQTSYNGLAAGNDSSSPPGAAAYGLYQCRNDLSAADCGTCVQSAVNQLSIVCASSFAASLQLDGCFVRYGHDNFLGQLDTTLLYSKCSRSTGNGDQDFFRRRDDVLADLPVGVGYRVSSSGSVQGYAQCLGDLSAADCTACLTQAVSQLKNACGSALAADVFLAKCYARYWASGYYLGSSGTDYSDDDIAKTVAIIVGVLAGLALFVVFLSFIKRAC